MRYLTKAKVWQFFNFDCSVSPFGDQKLKRRCFRQNFLLTWRTCSNRRCIGMRGVSWICNKEFLEVQSPSELHLCLSLIFFVFQIWLNLSNRVWKIVFISDATNTNGFFYFCPRTEDFRLYKWGKIGTAFVFAVFSVWDFEKVNFQDYLLVFLITKPPSKKSITLLLLL